MRKRAQLPYDAGFQVVGGFAPGEPCRRLLLEAHQKRGITVHRLQLDRVAAFPETQRTSWAQQQSTKHVDWRRERPPELSREY
ncbi:hypothetical protein Tdes44962_MAKER06263 [Teratosphaeria destructans]|uniref:Uncharacterized protein n=1 Tax=Teratosphaeria destructans TaxID=418781 RepID=A0A9W7SHT5_9PEZI|nr:hypothetical protein Tdes44962_MAKER06263 [Teratosphaeria destructans]